MQPSDSELLNAAKGGDFRAFEDLVHRYDANVLNLAVRFGNSREDAKDIYQEVFLRVFRNLHRFEGRSEFSTWLYRITTNVCLTFRSQRRREQSIVSVYPDEERQPAVNPVNQSGQVRPDQYTENIEVSARVSRALEKLSAHQKLVFVMKHFEGYKLREIAKFMGCAEGTVKRYLFTATRRLRTQLRDFQEVLS